MTYSVSMHAGVAFKNIRCLYRLFYSLVLHFQCVLRLDQCVFLSEMYSMSSFEMNEGILRMQEISIG